MPPDVPREFRARIERFPAALRRLLDRELEAGNSIATVAGAPLPSPDALVDFDVVQKLDAAPAADRELIALLQ